MSDGISEGYRMEREHNDYGIFLKIVAEYLKSPTKENLKRCLEARLCFGRYTGNWPKISWWLIFQISRLRHQKESEWAALLADCINEREYSAFNALKPLSPFKNNGVAVIECDFGGILVKGDVSKILNPGKTFEIKNNNQSFRVV